MHIYAQLIDVLVVRAGAVANKRRTHLFPALFELHLQLPLALLLLELARRALFGARRHGRRSLAPRAA